MLEQVPTAIAPTACTSMWLGGDLGSLSAACLASFVRCGHRVVLYCYDAPKDVPAGVELADAAKIVPANRVARHKQSGSYAPFSDLFRYELQRRDLGMWIDCDVYCVRPFDFEHPYVFGWKSRDAIATGVLRLPGGSNLTETLISLFDRKSTVHPWLSSADQKIWLERKWAGQSFDWTDLPWAATGPLALTYLAREWRLTGHAQRPSVFYPLPLRDAAQLLRAGTDLIRYIAPDTRGVHLWNNALRHHVNKAQRGSPIDRLFSEGTLFDEARLPAEARARS
jgi:hypothetical protein